jgi:hypothetical protein
VVTAGLEGDVHGRAARRLGRCGKRNALGVRLAGAPVKALADDAAVPDDDAADARVGIGRIQAELCELQPTPEALRKQLDLLTDEPKDKPR